PYVFISLTNNSDFPSCRKISSHRYIRILLPSVSLAFVGVEISSSFTNQGPRCRSSGISRFDRKRLICFARDSQVTVISPIGRLIKKYPVAHDVKSMGL